MQHLKGEAHKLGIGNAEMEREVKDEETSRGKESERGSAGNSLTKEWSHLRSWRVNLWRL